MCFEDLNEGVAIHRATLHSPFEQLTRDLVVMTATQGRRHLAEAPCEICPIGPGALDENQALTHTAHQARHVLWRPRVVQTLPEFVQRLERCVSFLKDRPGPDPRTGKPE